MIQLLAKAGAGKESAILDAFTVCHDYAYIADTAPTGAAVRSVPGHRNYRASLRVKYSGRLWSGAFAVTGRVTGTPRAAVPVVKTADISTILI